MAAELQDKLGVTTELIQSSGGVFEVELNDKLVFSKKELGRFPEDGEVLGLIQKGASAPTH